MNYTINVKPLNTQFLEYVQEAEGVFRIVRESEAIDPSDFNIEKAISLAKILLDNIKYVTIAATLIGIITPFGAAGTDEHYAGGCRTHQEIEPARPSGLKSSTIKQQFLFEAIAICQLGVCFRHSIGYSYWQSGFASNQKCFRYSMVMDHVSVVICFIVDLLRGYILQLKPRILDPIEALRYE